MPKNASRTRAWLCVLAAVTLCGFHVNAGAQPVSELNEASLAGAPVQSLPEMVAYARQYRPLLAAARSRQQAAAQSVNERRAGLLPQLSVNAGGGYQFSDTPSTRLRRNESVMDGNGMITGGGSADVGRWDVGLLGRQLLFDNNGTRSSIQAAREIFSAEGYVVEDTAEQLALQVVTAYVNVLQTRDAIDRGESNVAAHERIYDLVESLVESGRARRSDLAQVTARLAFAEAEVVRFAGEMAEAESIFYETIGLEPGRLTTPVLDLALLPETLSAAVEEAIRLHPRLKAAQGTELAAEADVDSARAPFLPEIALEVLASSGQNLNAVPGNNHNVQAQFRLNYDLYAGGADTARLKRAKALSSAARLERLEVNREIRERVRVAYERLTAAQRRIAPLTRQVDVNIQVVAVYEQQFEVGLRTLFDLLDAQQDLFASEIALVTAIYNEMYGGYFLLSTLGRLGDGLGISSQADMPYCGPGKNGPHAQMIGASISNCE